MTKDEYVKTLEEYVAGKVVDTIQDDYYNGYFDGLERAIGLAETLDEPNKVVIPEFIANDIDRRKKEGSTLRNFLKDVFDWGANDENIRKYINAWDNDYEVEKEPKYSVQIKGFDNYIDLKYVNYRIPDNTFGLDSQLESSTIKTEFTKQWLKDNWPEYDAYNNAGLLEFEEVEDE